MGNTALRLAGVEALAGLFLLVRGEQISCFLEHPKGPCVAYDSLRKSQKYQRSAVMEADRGKLDDIERRLALIDKRFDDNTKRFVDVKWYITGISSDIYSDIWGNRSGFWVELFY